ncbi:MAG: tRNA preQ1(34) S-adenosylmethionine ribosyltransferase-isomerase QueA [Desulfobulbaceae bacterium]|nr:tRNA preQ1(34) S-adenosylmethionine ribosyltransferase-isomerase QueA [Desulfobulbaceae bacterium]
MSDHFQLSAYDYFLPEENIAQHPAAKRDHSRLFILDCEKDRVLHDYFNNIINLFRPGDVLIVNNTRVFPARLLGEKETGGKVEVLLLHYPEISLAGNNGTLHTVEAMALVKSSKRPKPGSILSFGEYLQAVVLELFDNGQVKLELRYELMPGKNLDDIFALYGQVPLPPYIKRPAGTTDHDLQRYQTEYAGLPGSVAAPTAGLHFTEKLLDRIREKIEVFEITLHVGYGTFAPVRTEDIRSHRIHSEWIDISAETAEAINEYKQYGSRIWAVGTTTARALEFAANNRAELQPFRGLCDLYIYPGYQFKIIDNLITNFHLPRSSLLFLVAALVGRKRILECYREAVGKGYRFYSYGDAMALITRP